MKKVKALRQNPRRLLIYSRPKVGKTTIASYLDNALFLDFEKGSEFIDCMSFQINSVGELKEIGETIKEAGKPYDYIIVDTVTKLEELCLPLALSMYRETPMGRTFSGDSVLSLPNGAGYYWLREAFEKALKYIESLSDNTIMLGHLLDKVVDIKGKEVNAMDIDLTGKLKRIACQDSDAIGYLYREGNNTFITFNSSDSITCGARPAHLKGQTILISEANDAGTILNTHWDKIFLKK